VAVSKKRMMADVLWEAANLFLAASPREMATKNQELYSCPCVALAANGTAFLTSNVRDFLESLGCDTYSASLFHSAWKHTEKSQGVRYMWLLLAMHVAEDEGITV
jgi:hypothetical protein